MASTKADSELGLDMIPWSPLVEPTVSPLCMTTEPSPTSPGDTLTFHGTGAPIIGATHSADCEPAASVLPRSLFEMQNLTLYPSTDSVWEWDPAMCSHKVSSDSDACRSVRSTALDHTRKTADLGTLNATWRRQSSSLSQLFNKSINTDWTPTRGQTPKHWWFEIINRTLLGP